MTDSAKPDYRNPFLWVPSSYLAMGLVYVTVGSVANVMFKNMGMANDMAAFWSSVLGFPYTFKFLWAPLLELYKTKKFFVVTMQFALAAGIVGVALALNAPGENWQTPVLAPPRAVRDPGRDAGHRRGWRLRDDAPAEGPGEVHRVPEHVLERRLPRGRRPAHQPERHPAQQHGQLGAGLDGHHARDRGHPAAGRRLSQPRAAAGRRGTGCAQGPRRRNAHLRARVRDVLRQARRLADDRLRVLLPDGLRPDRQDGAAVHDRRAVAGRARPVERDARRDQRHLRNGRLHPRLAGRRLVCVTEGTAEDAARALPVPQRAERDVPHPQPDAPHQLRRHHRHRHLREARAGASGASGT